MPQQWGTLSKGKGMLTDNGGDPTRRAVLELNAELRKVRGTFAAPDQDSGHLAFLIPRLDYYFFTSKYPDLAASDPLIAGRAWCRFLNTDEGAKYKVNPTEGRTARRTGVIIK